MAELGLIPGVGYFLSCFAFAAFCAASILFLGMKLGTGTGLAEAADMTEACEDIILFS